MGSQVKICPSCHSIAIPQEADACARCFNKQIPFNEVKVFIRKEDVEYGKKYIIGGGESGI